MVEVQTVHAINAVAEVGMITVHGKVASRTSEVVQSEIAKSRGRRAGLYFGSVRFFLTTF
jgi:hypothetical protein